MYSITKATLKDAADILELQKVAYQSEAVLYNDWNLPALIQSLDSLQYEFKKSIVLKATIDNRILGSIRAVIENDRYKIGRLMVHPDVQKQGIGSALLKKIESLNVSTSIFELFTGSRSIENIRLYKRHGYNITSSKTLSEKIDIVFMEKHNQNPLAGWHDMDPGTIYRYMFGKI